MCKKQNRSGFLRSRNLVGKVYFGGPLVHGVPTGPITYRVGSEPENPDGGKRSRRVQSENSSSCAVTSDHLVGMVTRPATMDWSSLVQVMIGLWRVNLRESISFHFGDARSFFLRRRQNLRLNPVVEFLTSAQKTTARHLM